MNFLDLLNPYKYIIYITLIVGLLIGVYTMKHSYDAKQQSIGVAYVQAKWDESDKEKTKAQRIRELSLQKDVDNATIQAAKERQRSQVAALASANALSLSNSTIAKLRASSLTATNETNRKYITALTEVFDDCRRKYQELGLKADGHSDDSLMLDNAWPTK